jgi:amidase
MVPLAHGNDGGGSIRIPAACCGLVGLKPGRGRISKGPDLGDAFLVSDGVLSHSVGETAQLLDVLAGYETGDSNWAPPPLEPFAATAAREPGQLRIGLAFDTPIEAPLDPVCEQAARDAAELLESLGHGVESAYPDAMDDEDYIPKFLVRWTSGIDWNLQYWSARTGREIGPDDVEPATWALALAGREHSGSDYLRSLEYQQAVTRRAAEWWAGEYDLLLTPTMGEPPTPLGTFDPVPDNPAFPIERAVPTAIFTAAFNSTGQPAISLPLHWSDSGLPIGVQLVAAYGREDLLIRVASQLEEARPWAEREPAVFAAA